MKQLEFLKQSKISTICLPRDDDIIRHTKFMYSNGIIYSFENITQMLDGIKKIFNFGAIILFSISAFFSYFYFSGLIIEKTKEIGILKCLGLENNKAVAIFGLIGLFAFTMTLAFSIVSYALFCWSTNLSFSRIGIVPFKFVSFNLLSVGLISGSLLIGVFVGLIVPFAKIHKMKPIDILKIKE